MPNTIEGQRVHPYFIFCIIDPHAVSTRTRRGVKIACEMLAATLPLASSFASAYEAHGGADHDHPWSLLVDHDHADDHFEGRAARSSLCGGGGVTYGFSKEWGSPPVPDCSEELVLLKGGYGISTTSISEWVNERMLHDAEHGERHYPMIWGEPPMWLTKDLVLLPCGYEWGSSTLRDWILHQAEQWSRNGVGFCAR